MDKFIIFLLISIFINPYLLSETTDPFLAQPGYKLTNEAWVFSPDKALEVRNKLLDLQTDETIIQSLNRTVDLYKANDQINTDKVNLLLQQNDKLAKAAGEERGLNDWERIGFIGLGVAAAVLAGFVMKKAGQ
jgi:hypothetical protein